MRCIESSEVLVQHQLSRLAGEKSAPSLRRFNESSVLALSESVHSSLTSARALSIYISPHTIPARAVFLLEIRRIFRVNTHVGYEPEEGEQRQILLPVFSDFL